MAADPPSYPPALLFQGNAHAPLTELRFCCAPLWARRHVQKPQDDRLYHSHNQAPEAGTLPSPKEVWTPQLRRLSEPLRHPIRRGRKRVTGMAPGAGRSESGFRFFCPPDIRHRLHEGMSRPPAGTQPKPPADRGPPHGAGLGDRDQVLFHSTHSTFDSLKSLPDNADICGMFDRLIPVILVAACSQAAHALPAFLWQGGNVY